MELKPVIILIEENPVPSTSQEIQTKRCRCLSEAYKIDKIQTLLIFIALMLLFTYKIWELNNLIAQNQPNVIIIPNQQYFL